MRSHPVALWLLSAALASAQQLRTCEPPANLDALQAARRFADCMLQYGRDRYGAVQSPLFAVLLVRDKKPHVGPSPRFAFKPEDMAKWEAQAAGCIASNKPIPFNRFDFNKCLNYPPGLGGEGPHKVTVHGCDPWEDRELYECLWELTRVTGDAQYKAAADEALTWWFQNTQGPESHLFPWGEHLGWDFETEGPTYSKGPAQYLFSGCYHEIKDNPPFLDFLAGVPAAAPGARTPLELYALGIWTTHFWDKERAWFTRHGDYRGFVHRDESTLPAHLGAYLHVWAAAMLRSQDEAFRGELLAIVNKTVDMMLLRTEKWGAFPWNLEPDFKEEQGQKVAKNPKPCGQTLRLARHARDVGRQLQAAYPALAGKLERFAVLHIGEEKTESPPPDAKREQPTVRPLTLGAGAGPSDYERAIDQQVKLYDEFGDKAFLDVAQKAAEQAYRYLLDPECPLPRYRPNAGTYATPGGEPFPDFYFRGAGLMRAFVRLGEAQRKAAAPQR